MLLYNNVSGIPIINKYFPILSVICIVITTGIQLKEIEISKTLYNFHLIFKLYPSIPLSQLILQSQNNIVNKKTN